MKEHILDVLQMQNSSFAMPEADKRLLASPHIMGMDSSFGAKVSEVYPYNRAHGPSSTLLTSAKESCLYALAYLNEGSLNGSQILQPSSVQEMWREVAPADDFLYYRDIGLSWFLGKYKGYLARAHGGMDTGFRSNIVLLPEKGIAVTLMFNTDYMGLHSINNAILDVLLGEQVDYIPRSLTLHVAGVLAAKGLEAAVKEYDSVTDRPTCGFLPAESDFSFNTVIQNLLDQGDKESAAKVLRLGIRLDPNSESLRAMLEKMA